MRTVDSFSIIAQHFPAITWFCHRRMSSGGVKHLTFIRLKWEMNGDRTQSSALGVGLRPDVFSAGIQTG